MKITKVFLGAMVLSLAIQCGSPKSVTDTQETKVEKTIKSQVEEGAFIVDVRTPIEFRSGSFKGAVNIPLNQLESRLEEFKGKQNIIVFCRSGNRSGKAKNILEQNGFTNVTNGINQKHMEEKTK
ncbi:MAG: sulfurtransferase [Flavobacteriales bacterium]|nr:MAG: sulfurtransferase [Flavobacteriales bacterium]